MPFEKDIAPSALLLSTVAPVSLKTQSSKNSLSPHPTVRSDAARDTTCLDFVEQVDSMDGTES